MSLNNHVQGLTCVSAFSTLILWVEMKRSTSVRVWASPSEFYGRTADTVTNQTNELEQRPDEITSGPEHP